MGVRWVVDAGVAAAACLLAAAAAAAAGTSIDLWLSADLVYPAKEPKYGNGFEVDFCAASLKFLAWPQARIARVGTRDSGVLK
jgi:hypothetical protein